jgi:hypothetical protein
LEELNIGDFQGKVVSAAKVTNLFFAATNESTRTFPPKNNVLNSITLPQRLTVNTRIKIEC